LSVYKPWGMTPYGRRALETLQSFPISDDGSAQMLMRTTRQFLYWLLVAFVGLAILLVLHHLGGGNFGH
jgi:hypothetical protein